MAVDVHTEVHPGDGSPILRKVATSPVGRRSLADEAERLDRARHPGVVELLDAGEDRLDLAWAGGRTLATAPPPPERVAATFACLATTVADLHRLGIVHGRLRADHVVLDGHGRPRVCSLRAAAAHEPEPTSADDVAALGQLLAEAAGTDTDVEPIPERRWRRGRWTGYQRRALLTLADQATDPDPAVRPTARALAAALADLTPAGQAFTVPVDPGPDAVRRRWRRLGPPSDPEPTGSSVLRRPDDGIDVEEPLDVDGPPDAGASSAFRTDGPAIAEAGEPARPDEAPARPDDTGPDPDEGPGALDDDPSTADRRPLRTEPGAGDDPDADGGPSVDDLRDLLDRDDAGTRLARTLGLRVDHGPRRPTPNRPDHAEDRRRPARPDGRGGVGRPPAAVRPRSRRSSALALVAVVLVALVVLRGRTGTEATSTAAPAAPATAGTETTGPGSSRPTTSTAGAGPRDGCPPATGTVADVDGDGCPDPVVVDGRTVAAAGHRFAAGEAGDVVSVGDWDCDGVATVGLVRPSSGDIFLFDRWAAPGDAVDVVAVGPVVGARALAPTAQPCTTPRVLRADGTSVPVPSVRGAEP